MKQKEQFLSVVYLVKQLRPYRFKMLASIICGIIKEVSILVGAGICAYLVVQVFMQQPFVYYPWLLAVLICAMLRGVCAYLESFISHDVAYHALIDYRLRLYDHFIDLCPDILLRQRSGQISTTLMNDIEQLEWFYGHTFGEFFGVSFLCIAMLIIAGNLHIYLLLAVLISFCLIMMVPFLMKGKADQQGLETRYRLGEANSVTLEGINGMNEILTFNYRETYLEKINHFMNRLTHMQVIYARRMGIEGALLQGIASICALLCSILAMYLWNNGAVSLESFVIFAITIWLAFQPLVSFCMLARNFGNVFGASSRVAAVMNETPSIKDEGSIQTISDISASICFNHVSFAYEQNGKKVLDDVCFDVNEGEMVAIVGASGIGKTTCISLLGRLWDVKEGKIQIGGIDIRDMRLSTLHEITSVVLQDVYLFHGTIADNIRLGKPHATMQEVIEAAQKAKIHDFIVSLPNGYETNAGERGVQMSGGQRQRIAIARAILKDSPILVLDEAVSNLDAKTDVEIHDMIRSLGKQKTILMVAHRLSTILEADKIVVLKDGTVEQVGKHEQLFETCDTYRNLITTQMSVETE